MLLNNIPHVIAVVMKKDLEISGKIQHQKTFFGSKIPETNLN